MKVFVATKETQGTRSSDFCFCDEGEFVHFSFECSRDENNIDGGCGCRRSMSGFNSLKATTTFKVIDTNITFETFLEQLISSSKKAGWFPGLITEKDLREEAEDICKIASKFNVDYIIEKRGPHFQVRKVK